VRVHVCAGRGRVVFIPKEYEQKLGYSGFQAILQQYRGHILPADHEVRFGEPHVPRNIHTYDCNC
jgi:hypothetical protein